jgi:hypothetical protein
MASIIGTESTFIVYSERDKAFLLLIGAAEHNSREFAPAAFWPRLRRFGTKWDGTAKLWYAILI